VGGFHDQSTSMFKPESGGGAGLAQRRRKALMDRCVGNGDVHQPGGSAAQVHSRVGNAQDALARTDDLLDQVRRLEATLEHQERLATLGTIAGLIAHEFNNILTPMMSYAQMALGKPDDRDLATKALTKALDGAERAAQIASAILGFVRDDSMDLRTPTRGVRSGTTECGEPELAHADVRASVDEALACLARSPDRDGIRLTVEVEPRLGAAIRAISIQHVLLNVLLNSRNAMIPGGGELTISARKTATLPQPKAGGVSSVECSTWNIGANRPIAAGQPTGNDSVRSWVVIEIQDTGRGMSPERLARMFTAFHTTGERAERRKPCAAKTGCRGSCACTKGSAPVATPERRQGTGLGMTICKRLLDDAGGLMIVESEEGKGTRILVAIPAADGAASKGSTDKAAA
jgi:signal transduction histidine kinase